MKQANHNGNSERPRPKKTRRTQTSGAAGALARKKSKAGRKDAATHHEAPSKTSRRERKAQAGPCPIMHSCGGCEWIGVPYAKQLARKHDAMVELFEPVMDRFGWTCGIDPVFGMEPRPGTEDGSAGVTRDGSGDPVKPRRLPAPRGFRYKASTPFAPGADGSVLCGFYKRGTHEIVEVADCAVEAPGARRILNEVARVAERLGIPAYDEDSRRGVLRYAVLRLGWKSDEGVLTVVTATGDVPHAREFFAALLEIDPRVTCVAHNVNGREGNAVLGSRTAVVAGNDCMHDELLGCTFEISPTAFYQTNPQQTEELYRLAIEGMGLENGDVLLDAYCGSGTIGLAAIADAANKGDRVRLIGVERNPSGVADARRNALLNGFDSPAEGEAGAPGEKAEEDLPQATFITDDATSYMKGLAATGGRVDVLAMDPPRAGSTRTFLEAAIALAPRRIVYISCNPVTQVRDLEVLGVGGYRLVRLTPVDMFPHTEHVETVAVLERTGAED